MLHFWAYTFLLYFNCLPDDVMIAIAIYAI